ncbi:NAD(P)H-binding protein [Streptacidiphilus fuscans]|nr:NAD(P)H-binding protein [Streptacidiphilus fuscans]
MSMKLVLFGASGMVGQGVLRECLRDERVGEVVAVVRRPLTQPVPQGAAKLTEVVHDDFTDFSALHDHFEHAAACFFCLGVSSVGQNADTYRRITYDFTMAAARELAFASPGLTFTYVSGEGTDATERGRVAWARVKGATENALLAQEGLIAYLFRPGWIQPMHGERAKTGWYRAAYAAFRPAYPLVSRLAPRHVTTTENLGRAMLAVVDLHGAGPRVLASPEINELAAAR